MMEAWTVVIALSAWFAATVIYQCLMPRLAPRAFRFDPFRVIPAWGFFASDIRHFRLLYCDRLLDGSCTPWREAPGTPVQAWRKALWHPEFLLPDVVLTLVEELVELSEHTPAIEPARLWTSFAYRSLQHYTVHLSHPTSSSARQFRVVEVFSTEARRPPRVLFTSEWHPVYLATAACPQKAG